jgi:transposase
MASETDPIAPRTWVAIDIAKGVNVALMEHSDGQQQRFRFVHQRDDYDRLVSFLKACPEPCRIALEPTADYHRTIAYRLVSEGFDLVLVSSVAAARLREAVFNSWDKNDPKDAQVIMRLLKQGMTQRYCDPIVMRTHDLQELSKTYLHISRARTRLQHVLLTPLFDTVLPGDRAILDHPAQRVVHPTAAAISDTCFHHCHRLNEIPRSDLEADGPACPQRG